MGFMFWIPHLNNDFVCHVFVMPLWTVARMMSIDTNQPLFVPGCL